uniref:Uncharacterized protein n=1 Tax=Cacopsylla melanoneura TaxID=428564 RepID=A0A8D8XSU2_9HEMI
MTTHPRLPLSSQAQSLQLSHLPAPTLRSGSSLIHPSHPREFPHPLSLTSTHPRLPLSSQAPSLQLSHPPLPGPNLRLESSLIRHSRLPPQSSNGKREKRGLKIPTKG